MFYKGINNDISHPWINTYSTYRPPTGCSEDFTERLEKNGGFVWALNNEPLTNAYALGLCVHSSGGTEEDACGNYGTCTATTSELVRDDSSWAKPILIIPPTACTGGSTLTPQPTSPPTASPTASPTAPTAAPPTAPTPPPPTPPPTPPPPTPEPFDCLSDCEPFTAWYQTNAQRMTSDTCEAFQACIDKGCTDDAAETFQHFVDGGCNLISSCTATCHHPVDGPALDRTGLCKAINDNCELPVDTPLCDDAHITMLEHLCSSDSTDDSDSTVFIVAGSIGGAMSLGVVYSIWRGSRAKAAGADTEAML